MLKKISILIISLIILNFAVFAVKGSGNVIIEERSVSSFHTLIVNCNARVMVTKGSPFSVKIKSDDTIVPIIKTEVRQGALSISLTKIATDVTTLEINIVMENVNKLENRGSDSITTTNNIDTDTLELVVDGSGSINSNIKTNFTFLKVSGSGFIELSGNSENLETDISGNGEIKALNLNTKKSKVIVKGAGTCKLSVSNELEINVGGFGGNGKISFRGKPKMKIDVIGIASIASLD